MKAFLLACGSILLLSCISSKPPTETSRSQDSQSDSLVTFITDQTLVLLLHLAIDNASIRRARIVAGRNKDVGDRVTQEEILQIKYLNQMGNAVLIKEINNPLVQHREYAKEDGTMGHLRVEELEASALIRTPYSPVMRSIVVSYTHGPNQKLIAVLPLQPTP